MPPQRRQATLKQALERLHLQAASSMPGREKELSTIAQCLRRFIVTPAAADSLYICGVPGTGKSATLNVALDALEPADWKLVKVNGLETSTPNQVYQIIFRQLKTSKTVPAAEVCLRHLTNYFKKPASKTILVVDEIDYLVTKDERVLYGMFDWLTTPTANLMIVSISNTMQLSVGARIKSRIGSQFLLFSPYNKDVLQTIVKSRLADLHNAINPTALEFCSRRVANSSGDARTLLHIIQGAIKGALATGASIVEMCHVSKAFQENWAITSVADTVKRTTPLGRVILTQAIASLKSDREVTLDNVRNMPQIRCSYVKILNKIFCCE